MMLTVVPQVRGTCELDTRAVQVTEEAASLNSDDVFILETPAKTFMWIGKVRFQEIIVVLIFNLINSCCYLHCNMI